jgi:ketosteroid isomerase-like protein
MNDSIESTIVGMERAALDRWVRGDPSGFLEIYADDIVYFDPMQQRRLDGLAAVTKLYESIRGQVQNASYELLNPHVQVCGDMAVLTFNYAGVVGGQSSNWNTTEVYRKGPEGWRIIHAHWSLNNAK